MVCKQYGSFTCTGHTYSGSFTISTIYPWPTTNSPFNPCNPVPQPFTVPHYPKPLESPFRSCFHCFHEKKLKLHEVTVFLDICCWCGEIKNKKIDSSKKEINHGKFKP